VTPWRFAVGPEVLFGFCFVFTLSFFLALEERKGIHFFNSSILKHVEIFYFSVLLKSWLFALINRKKIVFISSWLNDLGQ
jgi:hypothetical protein